jgi:DNA-binding CsgD family transcriptional regulator
MAKSKWEDIKNKIILIEGWVRDRLTDKQIAKNLGIGRTTLNEKRRKALKRFSI